MNKIHNTQSIHDAIEVLRITRLRLPRYLAMTFDERLANQWLTNATLHLCRSVPEAYINYRPKPRR